MKGIILLIILCLTNFVFASNQVAKIVLLKGQATEFRPRINKTLMLEKGSWVLKNSVIKTSKSSVVKLLFIDKSRVTLGPRSELKISNYAQKKTGILTLMKGKLKASVLKNVLDKSKKNKLYIRTKTAAMGVRGTEFTVINNRKTGKTSVITFSGEVAMAQLSKNAAFKMPAASLKRALESKQAVKINAGQFAGTSKIGRPNIPIKINPAQFQTLKSSGMFEQGRKVASSAKKFQSKIPPRMNAKILINRNSELSASMAGVVGSERLKVINAVVKDNIKKTIITSMAPSEGFLNRKTGKFAPKAGGFIDVETGAYIVPPENSEYDPNTDTYIPPSEFGAFDQVTGEYRPPEGYVVTEAGDIILRAGLNGDRPQILIGDYPPLDDIPLDGESELLSERPDNLPIFGGPLIPENIIIPISHLRVKVIVQ